MTYGLLDLEVFVTAQRTGSLGRTGVALHLSQPSVSARLRSLERSLGASLFTRARTGVTLTAAGERFLPVAQRILDLADDGTAAVRSAEPVRRLVLGVHGTLAPSIVPRVAMALEDEPIELVVRDAHSGDLVRMVERGELTAAVVIPVPAPASVALRPLGDDAVVCAAAPGHRLVGRAAELAELGRWPIAVNTWGESTEAFIQLLADAEIPRRRVCWVATAATAVELALQLGYVAVLPASTVDASVSRGDLAVLDVPALPRWSVRLLLAHRRGRDPAVPLLQKALASRPSTKRAAM
jgi:DNA-binding transcriptional LysR family regulator